MSIKLNSVLILGVLIPLSCNNPVRTMKNSETSEKYEIGLKRLVEIDGESGVQVIENLKDFSPDMGEYIVEYVFGEIYCRKGISDKEREIVVVASLTALGNARPQLKVHINAALNTGCTPEELIQVINQTSPYAGIPASLNALECLREVMNERGIQVNDKNGDITVKNPKELGKQRLNSLYPGENKTDSLYKAHADLSPAIIDYILYTYGTILDEEKLSVRHRQMATIASLTALGTAAPQLRFHIKASLNTGITGDEIKEIMIVLSVYAGFPSALNGLTNLREIIG